MDLVRVGLGLRALRRRRGWRQRDVAMAAGLSQTMVSLIERGHSERLSIKTIMAAAAAVDARLLLQIRWRAGDLDRLLDADHALVAAEIARRLQVARWQVRVEVTYSTRAGSGSIDVLAWHVATRSLLVVEVKTEIPSAEATLRKLDEKVRLAAGVARERFAWEPASVSKLLAIDDSATNRRRLATHGALFDAAVPLGGIAMRRWLAEPYRAVAGRLFLSASRRGARIQRYGGRHRVRRVSSPAKCPELSMSRDQFADVDRPDTTIPTVLVG